MAGKLGWLAAFLFMACAALRLARFNTQVGIADKRYFQGLASPAAAGTLVFTIWFFVDNGIAGETVRWLIFFEVIALGLLMFTNVRYYSFKAGPSGDRVPGVWLLLALLIIVLLALDPPVMGMLLGCIYVLSGLVITIAGRRSSKLRRNKRPPKDMKIEPGIGSSTVIDKADSEDKQESGTGSGHA